MKFTKQDYNTLESAIKETLSIYPESEIMQARKTVKFVNNQFISFCWLCLHKTVSNSQSIRVLLGKYLDSHTETAIKRILVKYQ